MRKPGRRTLSLVAIAVLGSAGGAAVAGRPDARGAAAADSAPWRPPIRPRPAMTAAKARSKPKGRKGKDKDKEEPKPVPVELARASAGGIAAYYRAASVIEADRLVDLVARVRRPGPPGDGRGGQTGSTRDRCWPSWRTSANDPAGARPS